MTQNSQSYTDKIRQFAKLRVDTDTRKNALLEVNKRKAEIAKALSESAYFTGIREALEAGMLDLLVRFTMEHFSHFDGAKITLAFELAIAGKLECEAEHFGNFSGVYLSKIFTAYEVLERRYVAEYKREKEKKTLEEKVAKINPVEVAKNWAPAIMTYAMEYEINGGDVEVLWPEDSLSTLRAKVMFEYFIRVGIFRFDPATPKDFRPHLINWCVEMRETHMSTLKIAEQLAIAYRQHNDPEIFQQPHDTEGGSTL